MDKPAEGIALVDTPGGIADWLFRNRRTGEIELFQWPNAPLLVWFVATVAHRLGAFGEGRANEVLGAVASAALALWALLEIFSGVNPFRRMLGTVVLAWVGYSTLR